MNRAAFERVTRARARLIQDQPFWGCLALYLKIAERPDVTDTMATDGESVAYNPDFVLSLPEPELIGVWAHEVEHCALGHHARMGNRDVKEWNVAADLAINPGLKAQGFKLAKGMLDDPAFHGMGAEEIYAARRQQARQQAQKAAGQSGASGQQGASQAAPAPGAGKSSGGQSQGTPAPAPAAQNGNPNGQAGAGAQQPAGNQPGAGASGNGQASDKGHGAGGVLKPGSIEGKPGGEAQAADQLDKWNVRVREAAAVAKRANAGIMPAFAERIIQTISAPAVDYRDLLARWIDSTIAADYSFSRPNRRLIGRGVYLPGTIADALDHLVFAVDTSGSIDQHMLSACAAEIIGAMESGKVRKLTVIFADARVQAVQEFERGDQIKLAPKGGGGTRFADTFDRIAADYADATAVVYLTDMETADWGQDPAIPVMWAVHGDSRRAARIQPPFGEAVYIGRLE